MEVAALTAFLAPILGHLLKGTTEAAGKAAEAVGAKAWDYAGQLWRRLSDKVEQHPSATEAADDVAAHPDSPSAQGALTWQLEKFLEADPALKAEIAALWKQAQESGATVSVTATGERSVAVGGSVSGTISTGDTAAVPKPASGGGPA